MGNGQQTIGNKQKARAKDKLDLLNCLLPIANCQLLKMNRLFYLVLTTILFFSCSKTPGGGGGNPPPPPPPSNFAEGADVSWVTEMELAGKKFYSSAGAEMECMALLKSIGLNTIRIRVWVNPNPAWNNAADVLVKALRAKNLGLRIMINFHYSDSWADPGQQTKPAAWTGTLNSLLSAISTHTTDVLTQLKNNGITPEWVQVGNETNDGMLWPDGKASTSMNNFAQMVNAGYDAAKAVFPSTKVIATCFKWI